MSKFNKDLFLRNIYHLIKEKNYKIGQIEDGIGVSTGYFSRLKESSTVSPNIDLVCSISEFFNISVDRLIYSDLAGLNVSVRYYLDVLDYLYSKTKVYEITWENTTSEEFYDKSNIQYDYDYNDCYVDWDFASVIQNSFGSSIVYNSSLQEGEFLLENIFSFENGKNVFYINKINHMNDEDYSYELYIQGDFGFEGVCYANENSIPELFEAFNKLYNLCLDNMKYPKLNENIRNTFDKLMKKK